MGEMIDFDVINRTALPDLPHLLKEWLPNGKRVGDEWQLGDWSGRPGKSLLINVKTAKGSDFAEGSTTGDVIGIYARVFGVDRVRAARELMKRYGMGASRPNLPVPVVASSTAVASTCQPRDVDGERERKEREEKLDRVIANLLPITGTAAEMYLKSRGIKSAPERCFYFRRNQTGDGGALVGVARTEDGVIRAAQSVYLDARGRKAAFDVKKRTNGFPAGNPIRLPGDVTRPLLLTEGPEDALSLWQETSSEVWCAMGLTFISHAPLPQGREIVLVRDNDKKGSAADVQLEKIAAELAKKNRVMVARPPEGIKDANQLLQEKGGDAVRAMIDDAVREKEPPLAARLSTLPRSDIGNAARFAERYGKGLKYAPGVGWFTYENGVWRHDGAEFAALSMAKKTALAIAEEVAFADDMVKDDLRRWAKKSQDGARVNYMLRLAEPDMAADSSSFDRDRMLFNCANGVVDLRTGELLPHRPEMLLSKQSPVSYDPDAKAPRWERFVSEIAGGDAALVSFIRRAVGYSLTGDVREQCMFVLHGNGSNGKSTFLDTLESVFGGYHQKTKAAAFTGGSSGNEATPFIAMLRSARFVSAAESGNDSTLDEALIKEVTGEKTITVRNLHQNPFSFSPQFKLWFATNHKPEIRGTDDGVWRRLMLIPFQTRFYDADDPDAPLSGPFKDKTLPMRLSSELPGILAWAVSGCREWLKEGLSVPETVRAATREYREEMDVLGAYLEENCAMDGKASTACKKLYENYKKWCQGAGHSPYSQNKLGRRLYERGVGKGRTALGEKAYTGIRLLDRVAGAVTWSDF